MYEGAARVPLLIDDPQGRDGETCEQVVNNLDLYATVLDRCGADHDVPTSARILAPLYRNPDDANDDDLIYAELDSSVMVVDGDYKPIPDEDSCGKPLSRYTMGRLVPTTRRICRITRTTSRSEPPCSKNLTP